MTLRQAFHGRVCLIPDLRPRELVPRRALKRCDGARGQVPDVVHVPGDVQPPRPFLQNLDQVLVLLCRPRLRLLAHAGHVLQRGREARAKSRLG
jgi:hypothetical protein